MKDFQKIEIKVVIVKRNDKEKRYTEKKDGGGGRKNRFVCNEIICFFLLFLKIIILNR